MKDREFESFCASLVLVVLLVPATASIFRAAIAQVKTDLAIRDYVETQYDIEVDDITYYTRDKENDNTVCSGEIFPSRYVYTAILDEDMNICEMSLYQTTESDKDEKDVFEERGITITGEIPTKE